MKQAFTSICEMLEILRGLQLPTSGSASREEGRVPLLQRPQPHPRAEPKAEGDRRPRVKIVMPLALITVTAAVLVRLFLGSRQQNSRSKTKLPQGLQHRAFSAGQQHILEDWDTLTQEQKSSLLHEIEVTDLERLGRCFAQSIAGANGPVADLQPVQNTEIIQLSELTADAEAALVQKGLDMIFKGRVAVVLLAGGQGTRLGSTAPKGCYNIGLPSNKSLFRLQAERIARVQHLAARICSPSRRASGQLIQWYIMTSSATDAETRRYFEEYRYFGLDPDQVAFFQQGMLPCLTEQGKVIMASGHSMASAPDGNGGVFAALDRSGLLRHMADKGVHCVDCVSVDNALVRPADPLFIGTCSEHGADCGSRVLAKAYPEEKVGVFARKGGSLTVVEYSELDAAEASSCDPDSGMLRYNWSNVCMHYFSLEFLQRIAAQQQQSIIYHPAHKSIPGKNGPVKGVKLEQFIFDPFPLARSSILVEVARQAEFAPVKNASGSPSDSPDTARAALIALHTRWVEAAGGAVKLEDRKAEGVEVSPSVSYAGEGLHDLCMGRTLGQAYDVFLQGVVPAELARRRTSQERANGSSSRASSSNHGAESGAGADIRRTALCNWIP